MEDDGLGDWRIQAASRIREDVPPAYPGGPSHKAGDAIYLVTSTKNSKNEPVGFVTPSATAMALNIAMQASVEASRLGGKLIFSEVLTPEGKGKSIKAKDIRPLFDYFEKCMMAVTFSFQALEGFCNHTIANDLKGTFTLPRKKELKAFTVIELEREVSTEEKLSTVLPGILGVQSPKGEKVWENFVKLKRARDSTIHLKSTDQYPPRDIDRDTLFYQFLNNDPTEFPKSAIRMIVYFAETKSLPRWLLKPVEFVGQ